MIDHRTTTISIPHLFVRQKYVFYRYNTQNDDFLHKIDHFFYFGFGSLLYLIVVMVSQYTKPTFKVLLLISSIIFFNVTFTDFIREI